MTTFDEREAAFEAKFVLDQTQEFSAMARRNKLLGRWVAGKMGLSPESGEEYGKAIIRADVAPGDEDVFRKVAGDFKGAGITVSEGEIRSKIDEFSSIARDEIRSGI